MSIEADAVPRIDCPQVDAFLRRSYYWPHWLTPSARVTERQVLTAIGKHLERMRVVAAIMNFRFGHWKPVIVPMTVKELAAKAFLDSQWHHALFRAVDLPATLAYHASAKEDAKVDKSTLTNRAWEVTLEMMNAQIWQATAERMVGCWQRKPLRAGVPWTLEPLAAEPQHDMANAALSIAQQMAFHHAMNAVWLVMEPTLLSKGIKNPYADLIRVERWGYVVLGPDGGKVTATVRGVEREVPRFLIARLSSPGTGGRRSRRRRGELFREEFDELWDEEFPLEYDD